MAQRMLLLVFYKEVQQTETHINKSMYQWIYSNAMGSEERIRSINTVYHNKVYTILTS